MIGMRRDALHRVRRAGFGPVGSGRDRRGRGRTVLPVILAAVAGLLLGVPGPAEAAENPAEADRPNIVLIMADDMGYGDPGCYTPDSAIPTPNMDRLAKRGMRFTDAHSPSAVCTPTRYGLLTGRYAWRTRLKSGVLWGYSAPLLKPDRETIGSLLQSTGYRTGIVGKWHLGLGWQTKDDAEVPEGKSRIDPKKVAWNKRLDAGPHTAGFDYSYIVPASLDMPPYVYIRNGRVTQEPTAEQERLPFPDFVRAGVRQPDFEMADVLDHLTERATGFVQRSAEQDAPFFLYFPLTAPHKPATPAPRFRGATELGPYADFIHQVDATIGRVMEAIDEAGATEETLIIVTSDNGSYMRLREGKSPDHVEDHSAQVFRPEHHRANGPLRGTKADIWEAGHRVPFLVRWPGVVEPGSVNDETICLTDMLATCVEAAGVEAPEGAGPDSFSILPLLRGEPEAFDRAPVIHHSARGMFAVRDGKWKLVLGNGSGGRENPRGKPFERPYRLFDLSEDLGETRNLIEEHEQIADRLESTVQRIRSGEGK